MIAVVPNLAIYVSVLVAMLALGVAVRFLIVVPRRRCLQCGRSISVAAANCRGCGYRYSGGHELDLVERRARRARARARRAA